MSIIQPPILPFQAGGSSFVWSQSRITLSTTFETPIALFSANNREVCWDARNSVCYTTNEYIVLNAYADPAVTNLGDVQMPINMRIGSSTPASTTVHAGPTLTDYGTFLASLMVSGPITSSLLLLIDPGHSLLVTAKASTADIEAGFGFSWYELDLNGPTDSDNEIDGVCGKY